MGRHDRDGIESGSGLPLLEPIDAL
jgi:hypothetical protein